MNSKVQNVATTPVFRVTKLAENGGKMVGERGFEPPAPASRRHSPSAHTAIFHHIGKQGRRISVRLFSLSSRQRFKALPSTPVLKFGPASDGNREQGLTNDEGKFANG